MGQCVGGLGRGRTHKKPQCSQEAASKPAHERTLSVLLWSGDVSASALFSKAVCYINIFEKNLQPLTPLARKVKDVRHHGEVSSSNWEDLVLANLV